MPNQPYQGSRRSFLQMVGAGSCLAGAGIPEAAVGSAEGSSVENIYAELGVRTLINGRGVATFYSGILMPPEVRQAM